MYGLYNISVNIVVVCVDDSMIAYITVVIRKIIVIRKMSCKVHKQTVLSAMAQCTWTER